MPRKSGVRLTDGPDMTLDVYRGRKTTIQQQQQTTTTIGCIELFPLWCYFFLYQSEGPLQNTVNVGLNSISSIDSHVQSTCNGSNTFGTWKLVRDRGSSSQ